MLVPKLDPSTGEYTYDSGKYLPIAAVGLGINHHCVATSTVGGSGAAVGGYDDAGESYRSLIPVNNIFDQRVGDNGKLRFILYARDSEWDKKMQQNQKNGIPLSMNEDEDEDEEQDKNVSSLIQVPLRRLSKPGHQVIIQESRPRQVAIGSSITILLQQSFQLRRHPAPLRHSIIMSLMTR